ncbi:hypothetical protein CMEL01_14012 [Colletotrichum melonis]|uniref:Kinesin light chain n=1 Tax=Colletotrichum melonis TaxID=1209925 RepID=A0AAI9UP22_9PEZI|nr:hypothetical protein CMEL01_14012 [Colletotrichum melonis]
MTMDLVHLWERPHKNASKISRSFRGFWKMVSSGVRRKVKVLDVHIQRLHVETVDNDNKQKVLQIVDLRCYPPSKHDGAAVVDTAKRAAVSEKYSATLVSVYLTSTECFNAPGSPAYVINELEVLLEKIVAVKRSGKTSGSTNYSARLVIIADEIMSWMVKDIVARAVDTKNFLTKISGLIFLDCQQHPSPDHNSAAISVASHLKGTRPELVAEISRNVDKIFFDGRTESLLEPVTWVLRSRTHAEKDADLLSNPPQALQSVLEGSFRLARQEERAESSEDGSLLQGRNRWLESQKLIMPLANTIELQNYGIRLRSSSEVEDKESAVQLDPSLGFSQGSLPAPEADSAGDSQSRELSGVLEKSENSGHEGCDAERNHHIDGFSKIGLQNAKQHSEANPKQAQANSILRKVAKAGLLAQRGDHVAAIGLYEHSLRDSIRIFGEIDSRTLETALQLSSLMIHTSRVAEGRVLAQDADLLIYDNFGGRNSLAIRATYVLISAIQAEGRQAQALNRSLELCCTIQDSKVPTNSMLALQCSEQLGVLHIRRGNYKSAEEVLQEAYYRSLKLEGRDEESSVTWKLLSSLALAQVCRGKRQKARTNLGNALRCQLEAFLGKPKASLWQTEEQARSYVAQLMFSRHFKGKASEVLHGGPMTGLGPIQLSTVDSTSYQEVLYSLFTFAKIEASSRDSDDGLIADILYLVWAESSKSFGHFSEITLEAALSLRNLLAWTSQQRIIQVSSTRPHIDPKRLSKYHEFFMEGTILKDTADKPDICQEPAEGSLYSVDRTQQSHLGSTHPIVLRNRHDAIKSSILSQGSGTVEPHHLEIMKSDLEQILSVQEERLGGCHPDTLTTMATLLAVQVEFGDSPTRVIQTKNDLIRRHRNESVRAERSLQCLLLEERIANLLLDEMKQFGYFEAINIYNNILEQVSSSISDLKEDADCQAAIKELRSRCEFALTETRNKARDSGIDIEPITRPGASPPYKEEETTTSRLHENLFQTRCATCS